MPRKKKAQDTTVNTDAVATSAASTTAVIAEPVAETPPTETPPQATQGISPAVSVAPQPSPARDPREILAIPAGDNTVRLFKSHADQAFIIRFDKNPNEGRTKENPNPALTVLKNQGYRWRASQADKILAWGKQWPNLEYSHAAEFDAKKLAQAAADAMGPRARAVGRS